MSPENRRGTCMTLRPYRARSRPQGVFLPAGRFPSRGRRRDLPGHARPPSASPGPRSDPVRPDCNQIRKILTVET